jgi:hypothetical protein
MMTASQHPVRAAMHEAGQSSPALLVEPPRTGFWYLIEVGNSLCLCVAVMHQPVLAFEVRS